MGPLPAYPVSFLGIHSFNLLLSGVVQDETYLEHQVKTLTQAAKTFQGLLPLLGTLFPDII